MVVAGTLLAPIAALSQIAPEKPVSTATEPSYKYQVYGGWGYTSLNQVNQSRSGLMGYEVGAMRNFGRFFGVFGQYGSYQWTVTSANVGNPTVNMILVGPELHAPLYGRFSGSFRALFGTEHVGNISIQPDYSFAGGYGIGVDYALSQRLSLRLGGDNIGSAFTVVPYSSGASTHTRWNAHASFGVAYKF
jgi:hypothetical protein